MLRRRTARSPLLYVMKIPDGRLLKKDFFSIKNTRGEALISWPEDIKGKSKQ